jgi:hypothetical protein
MKYKTSFLCLFAGIAAFGFSGMASAENNRTKQVQTISFTPASASIVVGGTVVVKANSTSGLSVTLSQDSTTAKYCSFNQNTGLITGSAVGTCKINATQRGNYSYASANAVLSIPVTQTQVQLQAQTISFGAAPTLLAGGTGAVTATASSGLPVLLASTTPLVCSVNGNTVLGISAGLCTITADQAGNANFKAAPELIQSFNIGKGAQTITFGAAPKISVGSTGTVTVTASSGLAVLLASTTPTICKISGNSVTGLGVESECRIPTVKILVRPWPKIGLHRHGLMPAAPWPSTSLEDGTSCSRMTLRAIGRPCRFSMKTRPAPVRFQGLFGRHSLSLSFLSKQR